MNDIYFCFTFGWKNNLMKVKMKDLELADGGDWLEDDSKEECLHQMRSWIVDYGSWYHFLQIIQSKLIAHTKVIINNIPPRIQFHEEMMISRLHHHFQPDPSQTIWRKWFISEFNLNIYWNKRNLRFKLLYNKMKVARRNRVK